MTAINTTVIPARLALIGPLIPVVIAKRVIAQGWIRAVIRARKWGTCQWCQGWDSKFCEECEVLCNGCGGTICADCMHTCECCGARRCDECDPEILKCDNCNATNCEACFDEDNYSVRYCEECDRALCSSCRVGDCKKDGRGC